MARLTGARFVREADTPEEVMRAVAKAEIREAVASLARKDARRKMEKKLEGATMDEAVRAAVSSAGQAAYARLSGVDLVLSKYEWAEAFLKLRRRLAGTDG